MNERIDDSSPAPCSIPDNVKTALEWFVNSRASNALLASGSAGRKGNR